jgi:hypothetical protein
MKEDLIRTNEENERHKQLVTINRKRRELLKQKQQSQLTIPQVSKVNDENISFFHTLFF